MQVFHPHNYLFLGYWIGLHARERSLQERDFDSGILQRFCTDMIYLTSTERGAWQYEAVGARVRQWCAKEPRGRDFLDDWTSADCATVLSVFADAVLRMQPICLRAGGRGYDGSWYRFETLLAPVEIERPNDGPNPKYPPLTSQVVMLGLSRGLDDEIPCPIHSPFFLEGAAVISEDVQKTNNLRNTHVPHLRVVAPSV